MMTTLDAAATAAREAQMTMDEKDVFTIDQSIGISLNSLNNTLNIRGRFAADRKNRGHIILSTEDIYRMHSALGHFITSIERKGDK